MREELEALSEKPKIVVIDEIQKVPALLDEVHHLIEEKGIRFALCGSSARKVRRGHANLLGGRAIRYELQGFVSKELSNDFDLLRILNHGTLPKIYFSSHPKILQQSYIENYLKEEIAAEGLIRDLPPFANFLHIASFSDSEIVNYSNIASECGVSSPTVKEYFQILEDTMLASFLPAFTKRPKRRTIQSPKFYYFDVGIVNHLAKRGKIELGSELFGKALEAWIYHELNAHRVYHLKEYDLSYWRLSSGIEVDFIVGNAEIAIEVKSTQNPREEYLKGLRQFKIEYPEVKNLVLVCMVDKPRKTSDGILILPIDEFCRRLWSHEKPSFS